MELQTVPNPKKGFTMATEPTGKKNKARRVTNTAVIDSDIQAIETKIREMLRRGDKLCTQIRADGMQAEFAASLIVNWLSEVSKVTNEIRDVVTVDPS